MAKNGTFTFELNREERHEIADAINIKLKGMAKDYAASCDRKAPNKVLLQAHGHLMRLRDRILTGKTNEQLDDEVQRSAERSERAFA